MCTCSRDGGFFAVFERFLRIAVEARFYGGSFKVRGVGVIAWLSAMVCIYHNKVVVIVVVSGDLQVGIL
jgi:hypothetical protein